MSNNRLKKYQKNLRLDQTNAESLLWSKLRNRNFMNLKFRRQHIMQGYIVDFICLSHKIILELDGGQHSEQKHYDDKRSVQLVKDGFKVLRFWNNEVFENLPGVLTVIRNNCILEGEQYD